MTLKINGITDLTTDSRIEQPQTLQANKMNYGAAHWSKIRGTIFNNINAITSYHSQSY